MQEQPAKTDCNEEAGVIQSLGLTTAVEAPLIRL